MFLDAFFFCWRRKRADHLRRKGYMAFFSGHHDKALERFDKACAYEKSGRNDSSVLAQLTNQKALCHFKEKRYIEATELCSLAIDIDPSTASIYYCRARAHYEMKRLVEAYEDAQKALQLDPKCARAEELLKIISQMEVNKA